MTPIRVAIADDHALMRMGLRNLLNKNPSITVVGEAEDGQKALEMVERTRPDVLILDMQMPILDGVAVAERLKKAHSPVKILAFSAFDDKYYILSLLELGAAGYLVKDEDPSVLVDAVKRTAAGETGWISPRLAKNFSKSLH